MNGFDLSTISSIYVGSTLYSLIYIGSNKVWPVLTTLPYDAEIEYLEATGTQYIDSLITHNSSKGAYVDFEITVDNVVDQCILGVGSDSFRWGICWYIDNSTHYLQSCGLSYQGFSWLNHQSTRSRHGVYYNYENDATVVIDGSTMRTGLPKGTLNSGNIYVFAFNYNGGGSTWRPAKMKLYSCKITDNGTVVRDFIPVRVGQSGYMYDKVSGQLFGNSGTGSFILGRDKLPTGYTELEYISSSSGGNQYIDLGIKLYETLNTNYDIAMKFNIASGNANQAAMFACQDSDNNPWPGTFVRVNSSSGKAVGRYIGGTAKDNTLGNLGADIELPVQTSPNKNVTSLNNNNTTHQYGTSLFCAFVGGTNTPARYCNAKLYYFKLFVGGTLVRDLIPCKNSNNVVGMYDVVNNVFYTSPNGNAFVAGPSVNLDYVTNGLIFHLDGINKGTGADWVDLIGGIQFTKNGTDSASTSNSWNFPGNSGDYLIYTGSLNSIGGSDDFTVEVCYNNSSNSSKMYVFGCGHNDGTKYPLYYHDGTYITWIQGGYTYNASSMTGNSKYTVSLNNNSGLVNGLLILKTSSTDYWDATNTDFRIGSALTGSATSYSMNGDIYSIRIYNRKLSQSEQLQNQMVDNLRFNLGLSI